MKLNTFSNDNNSTGNVMSDIFPYFWIKREQYVLCSISIFNPLKNIAKKICYRNTKILSKLKGKKYKLIKTKFNLI